MARSTGRSGGFARSLGLVVLGGLLIFGGFYFAFTQNWFGLFGRPSPAPALAQRELCNLTLAGSNTIGEKLAPAIVTDLLRYNKYKIEGPVETAPDEVRIVGLRGDGRCTIEIRSHGSQFAFDDLAANQATIGMASRAIRPKEVDAFRKAGAGDFETDAGRMEHVIALDGIAIIVHPSNPIRALAKRDVKRIFLGQIRNWSELGREAAPIQLYARDDNSGTFQFFHENVLEKDKLWDDAKRGAQRFESSSALVKAVAADPNAIGFVGLAYINSTVDAVPISDGGPAFSPTPENVRTESYPISRRLFLYVRANVLQTNLAASALVTHFKSPAAYPVVEAEKYVSLRADPTRGPLTAAAAAPKTTAAAVMQQQAAQSCQIDTAEAQAYNEAIRGGQRLPAVIRFREGGTLPDSLARDDLERTVPRIRQSVADGLVVRLVGHSDNVGDAAQNRTLALRRAERIRQAFEERGVFGVQIESAGEMCPVADNETADGRRSNRRVEIWIAGPAA